jgi:hypothetical protein
MEKLLMLMASIMTWDSIIDQMKEAISKYDIDPSEENKKTIVSTSLLINTKFAIDNKEGGVEEIMDQYDKSKENQEIGARITGTNKDS